METPNIQTAATTAAGMTQTAAPKPTWGKVALGSFSAPSQTAYLQKVYLWMCIGLIVSAVVAYGVASTPTIAEIIIGNRIIFYGLMTAEFIAVIFLAAKVHTLPSALSSFVFLLYAVLNGLTFSVIFYVFTINSIGQVFFLTAGMFGAMSFYGGTTNRDLTTMGSFATMGLFGLVIAMVLNIFLGSDTTTFILSGVGVVVFVLLTAYDTQKLRWMYQQGLTEGEDGENREAINGALTLYLDFVNLFFDLLSLLGKRN